MFLLANGLTLRKNRALHESARFIKFAVVGPFCRLREQPRVVFRAHPLAVGFVSLYLDPSRVFPLGEAKACFPGAPLPCVRLFRKPGGAGVLGGKSPGHPGRNPARSRVPPVPDCRTPAAGAAGLGLSTVMQALALASVTQRGLLSLLL